MLAQGILEALGFCVARTTGHSARQCDFLVSDERSRYLVEVKSRFDNEELDATLDSGKCYFDSQDLHYSAAVERTIRHAMKQLRASSHSARDAFWIVWLYACKRFGRSVSFKQAVGTLYGITEILSADREGTALSRGCLFFRESVFFRWPELVASIVCEGHDNFALCLNPFGSAIDAFRNSRLCQEFAQRSGVFDPDALSVRESYYVADCGIDRKQPHQVLGFVKTKYGLEVAWDVYPKEHAALAAVPRPDNKT